MGDFVRANAKFRLTVEFKYAEFEHFKEPTASGYSALIKAFLTWSAYEIYCELIRVNNVKTKHHLARHRTFLGKDSMTLETISYRCPRLKKAFKFIEKKLTNADNKDEIERYNIADNNFNPVAILAGVRHIFVHGQLTPNVHDTYNPAFVKIVDKVTHFTLKGICDDFRMRVKGMFSERVKESNGDS